MASEPTIPTGIDAAAGRYLVDFFLESVKRAARLPSAQVHFQTWEILAEADKKMRDYIAPLVIGIGEDYMTAISDQAITTETTYRPPSRALKLREVEFLDYAGEVVDVPRISVEALNVASWGFYFVGNSVELLNAADSNATTLRLWYYLRPSRLIASAEAGVVESVNTSTGAITLTEAVSGFTGKTAFDIIRGTSPFEVVGLDVAGTVASEVVTVAAADLPDGLAAGDLVCLPQETPFPQCSPELWDLLVQATAVELLDQVGDKDGFDRASSKLQKLDADARVLLSARVEGEPQVLGAGANAIWDRQWTSGPRWGG